MKIKQIKNEFDIGTYNLDDRENALDLLWLPAAFPKNVCVVLSVAPGKVAEGKKK
jgi:hypothetical protein